MVKNTKLQKKEDVVPARKEDTSERVGPFMRYKYEYNEKTGKNEFVSLDLSDGTKKEHPEYMGKLEKALKEATGTHDIHLSQQILTTAAVGMTESKQEDRLNHLALMLPGLSPQNETEAVLLSQFIALQKSGFRCLRNANDSDNFFHIEGLFSLATKLFRTANETMQTLVKYRSGGRQEIQIVHLHNEGQAIVTQNLSTGEGVKKNMKLNPMDDCGAM